MRGVPADLVVGGDARVTRGAWRLVANAVVVTIATIVSLPLLDLLSAPPPATLAVRRVDTVELPPPPPPPPPPVANPLRPPPPLPLPRLAEAPPRVAAVAAPLMALAPEMPTGIGDVAIRFPVATESLLVAPDDMIFDVLDADSPPHPLGRLTPLYPPQARMRRLEGEVQVEFVVTAEGAVTEASVVHAEPAGVFEDAVLHTVRRWRFEPGLKDGRPVAVRVRQRMTFKLDE